MSKKIEIIKKLLNINTTQDLINNLKIMPLLYKLTNDKRGLKKYKKTTKELNRLYEENFK